MEENQTTQPKPATFKALALLIITNIYLDVHVKLSGIVFFSTLACGVVYPQYKDQCRELVGYAGTYLFVSALKK